MISEKAEEWDLLVCFSKEQFSPQSYFSVMGPTYDLQQTGQKQNFQVNLKWAQLLCLALDPGALELFDLVIQFGPVHRGANF